MKKKLIYCEYEQKRDPRKNLEDLDWYLPYDGELEFKNRFCDKHPEILLTEVDVYANELKCLYYGEFLLQEKDKTYYSRWATKEEEKLYERYLKANKLMKR